MLEPWITACFSSMRLAKILQSKRNSSPKSHRSWQQIRYVYKKKISNEIYRISSDDFFPFFFLLFLFVGMAGHGEFLKWTSQVYALPVRTGLCDASNSICLFAKKKNSCCLLYGFFFFFDYFCTGGSYISMLSIITCRGWTSVDACGQILECWLQRLCSELGAVASLHPYLSWPFG